MVNQYIDAFNTQKEEFHKLDDAYKELKAQDEAKAPPNL
jgi:hypothetical protein